jgi:hypothetical protein
MTHERCQAVLRGHTHLDRLSVIEPIVRIVGRHLRIPEAS